MLPNHRHTLRAAPSLFAAVCGAVVSCALPIHGQERTPGPDGGTPSQPAYSIQHQTKVPVPMRDGVKLAAEVFRPDAPGKFPALMLPLIPKH